MKSTSPFEKFTARFTIELLRGEDSEHAAVVLKTTLARHFGCDADHRAKTLSADMRRECPDHPVNGHRALDSDGVLVADFWRPTRRPRR